MRFSTLIIRLKRNKYRKFDKREGLNLKRKFVSLLTQSFRSSYRKTLVNYHLFRLF